VWRNPARRYRQVHMDYGLEFDFALLSTCNGRCAYCFIPLHERSAEVEVVATNEEWERAFVRTEKRCLIHVTGGEPFLYPRFADLCRRLARTHYLSINSSLSSAAVTEFTEQVPPERVHFVNAALHWEERSRRGAGVAEFASRASALVGAGFTVYASIVMTPRVIECYDDIVARMSDCGVALVPKVMYGRYEGRIFPAAYSDDQRSSLVRWIVASRECHGPVLSSLSEPPTINPWNDVGFIQGQVDYRGRACTSGSAFVGMGPSGGVFRCGSGEYLGNLLRGTLALLETRIRCDATYCHYFCEKYSTAADVRIVPSSRQESSTRCNTGSRCLT
jgi:hypothetical protein